MVKHLSRQSLGLSAVALLAVLSAAILAQEAQPTPVKQAPSTAPTATTAPAALTAEQEEELLAFFKKHDSPQYSRLMDELRQLAEVLGKTIDATEGISV